MDEQNVWLMGWGDPGMKRWDVRNLPEREMLSALQEPAALLRQGGVIAFPTETVYGLGANALSEDAVRRIFAAKGRPSDNPLIVHIADVEMLAQVTMDVTSIPETARLAMRAFWPGPLTVILPAHPDIAASVRPGLSGIGVRMPAHPVARALIRAAGCPLAAPSANLSGKPSPTTADDVAEDMVGRIDGIVDGGSCEVGVESTVVAISAEEAVIYRPGGISLEQLAAVLPVPVSLDPHLHSPTEAPRAPGMKYRHYAPDASVHVWWGRDDNVIGAIQAFVQSHPGDAMACVAPRHLAARLPKALQTWSPAGDEPYDRVLSREIYRLLRSFDRQGVRHVLVVGVTPEGYGAAVMNRLQKASEGRLHHV